MLSFNTLWSFFDIINLRVTLNIYGKKNSILSCDFQYVTYITKLKTNNIA